MYCTATNRKVKLNGKRIEKLSEQHIENASICLEIPSRYSPREDQRRALEKMFVLIERAYRVRIIGVGSLGLCFCASGGFDAYVNLGSMWKLHDIAAGRVIVQEAGRKFLYAGEEKKQIIAGPEKLCGKICKVLKI